MRKGTGQPGIRHRETMHAHVACIEEPDQFRDGGSFQMYTHVELVFTAGTAAQHSTGCEQSESLPSAIGARRSSRKSHHHIAALVRINIQIGSVDIEN